MISEGATRCQDRALDTFFHLWWNKPAEMIKEVTTSENNSLLTNAEFRMLAAIARSGRCTTRELEDILGIKKSAAHKYLTKLRSAGLVEGVKDDAPVSHRPRYYFFLTEEGAGRLEREAKDRHSVSEKMVGIVLNRKG